MLDLQSTFQEIGGFGLFQVLVCATGSLTCGFAGGVIGGGAFNNLLTCVHSNVTGNGSAAATDGELNGSRDNRHGFISSVSVEYHLCSDLASLGELSAVFLLAGCIPGSLLAGPAADTLGRIPGTLIGLLGTVSMNLLATFAPYFWLHLGSRLVCGFFVSWTMGSIFVYGNEVLLTEHRSRFVMMYNLGPAIAGIMLAYLAYAMRDYKKIMIANNFIAVLPLVMVALLPESPSWLMSQRSSKSLEQVRRALRRIAWLNRRPLPDNVALASLPATAQTDGDDGERDSEPPTATDAGRRDVSVSLCAALASLLFNRVALGRLLATCLYGFSSGFAYYGFTFVISHSVPNIYVTFALMGAVEPPSLLLLNLLSRSRTLFASALATAVACFAIGVAFALAPVGHDVSPTVSATMIGLAVAGKFFSNISFCAIVAVGAEIYPTAVRNTGLGLLLASLRIGCMMSPLVNFIRYLPARFAALGIACLLAAFPIRSLPDTRVRDLMENGNELTADGVAKGAAPLSSSQLSSQAL